MMIDNIFLKASEMHDNDILCKYCDASSFWHKFLMVQKRQNNGIVRCARLSAPHMRPEE